MLRQNLKISSYKQDTAYVPVNKARSFCEQGSSVIVYEHVLWYKFQSNVAFFFLSYHL